MNDNAFRAICQVLDQVGAEYKILSHPPCRTSEESAAARTQAGTAYTLGAKALLVKLELDGGVEFATFVIPGPFRLDNQLIKKAIPGLRKFRFASTEEMLRICGVLPGCMPPFGSSVFPKVSRLYVDTNTTVPGVLGFNAAMFERSIVISSEDYLKAVTTEASIVSIARHTNGVPATPVGAPVG